METLRKLIEENDQLSGKIFDLFFQFLILLSLVIIVVETLPEMEVYQNLFQITDNIIVIIFSIEYALRIWVSKKRWKFIRSPGGIIDLLAILPFYLSLGSWDFRFIRILRLFRLLRIFKIARYNKAIARFANAFFIIKEELLIFVTMVLFLFFISAAGIYHFEHPIQPEKFKSIVHCLWWAVTTFTPAASDMIPITAGGKIFTFCILILGLGIVAVPAGLFASALMRENNNREKKETNPTE